MEKVKMATFNHPKVRRASRWFDVRRRKLGMWAYALNRITGIGLVVYLYLHLGVLSLLARGQTSWHSFVSLARSPYYLALDVILLAGILIHGLNGLRVALTGFDVGVRAHKALFGVSMLVAAVALVAAALKIFGG
jgi:succinate dehydrogenase / fumarate reductase, cytochrome b subunit